MTDVPESPVDLWADEVLADPYPVFRELRELGPVVFCPEYGIYALTGYPGVRDALRDHDVFSTGLGVGFTPIEDRFLASVIISASPPEHTRIRGVIGRSMGLSAISRLESSVRAHAEAIVKGLLERGTFDAVPEVAEALPLRVVGDFIGFPEKDRPSLLPWAYAAFDLMGPPTGRVLKQAKMFETAYLYLFGLAERRDLTSGSVGMAVFEAVDQGKLEMREALSLFTDTFIVSPIVSTTTLLSNLLLQFAKHPAPWARLVAQPSLAYSAVEESLRYEAPLPYFFRQTTRDVNVSGTVIPAASRVVLMLGSANRDPANWQDPDSFDIGREVNNQLSFGGGIHTCLGIHLARLEARVLLETLSQRVATLELASTPTRRPNTMVRGYASMPFRVTGR